MQNLLIKITIGFFIVFVLFFGIMLLFQQKAINQLRSQISAIENASIEKKVGSTPANLGAPHLSLEDIESPKSFTGKIKSAAADSLDIDAELFKVKNPDKLQGANPKNLTPDDYEIITKSITVLLNDKTQYFGLKKEDLKAGTKMFVNADKSPFNVDSLTALEVAPYEGM